MEPGQERDALLHYSAATEPANGESLETHSETDEASDVAEAESMRVLSPNACCLTCLHTCIMLRHGSSTSSSNALSRPLTMRM